MAVKLWHGLSIRPLAETDTHWRFWLGRDRVYRARGLEGNNPTQTWYRTPRLWRPPAPPQPKETP